MRFLPASDRALLIELDGLRETLALFDTLRDDPVPGVLEAVPAARTILLEFQPHAVSARQLAAALWQRRARVADLLRGGGLDAAGRLIELPVRYDGQDLEALAEHLGISAAQLIELHTGHEYHAAFAGFAPGFVYLAGNPFGAPVPRLNTPRTRVPASSVAVAGDFGAVYPQDSPGGWQLLGTTPCSMWDMRRAPPALLQPGLRVRFVDMARAARSIHIPGEVQDAPATGATGEVPTAADDGTRLKVQSAGVQTLVQDLGRRGQTGMGVSASGALDRCALRAANRLVGNPGDAAVLENALGHLRLHCEQGAAVVAVTGADIPVQVLTASGRRIVAGTHRPLALDAGDTLDIGAPSAGVRCYVAVRGGLDVAPVLGSRATDTLAAVGPPPLRLGDVLNVGTLFGPGELHAVQPGEDMATRRALPRAGEALVLDVVLGPRTDWFPPETLAVLQEQEWTVTPQSNRVGIRLAGERPLLRTETLHAAELPSEGTVRGALQVPASGQPVLFLADHPLTGGYPVIGAVAGHHLDLCAQIPVGARLRFNVLEPFAEIVPPAAVS
ncbi:5-oxoprolinase/urea amidolyase family protein [Pseudothauera nasutitermitis]|uniref:5-oxoprolinase/urea amidolyase family protein n=1 Tax=Pseudothauera nasutitermitis TaxID=2565930 RepID=A0A4S4B0G5_9RHOO|nr:urea amidolyase family protein [Pseudothauera nasutitermitis]THF65846.1 5-oxoprolinase/urea amidolyase family protein [Pseudothauera nasutitermitis]